MKRDTSWKFPGAYARRRTWRKLLILVEMRSLAARLRGSQGITGVAIISKPQRHREHLCDLCVSVVMFDDTHDPLHDLVDRQIRGVDDGVGVVEVQRRVGAGGVLLVAGDGAGEDGFVGRALPFCQQLGVAAAARGPRGGR